MRPVAKISEQTHVRAPYENLLDDVPCGDVSPYLERPIRTLSQAQQDQNTSLLDLVTQDGRLTPKP
jgi:hypothetical protein